MFMKRYVSVAIVLIIGLFCSHQGKSQEVKKDQFSAAGATGATGVTNSSFTITPTAISIADKKFKLEQLEIDKAISDLNLAQLQAQLNQEKILAQPSTALQKVIEDVMDELGIAVDDRKNWNYNQDTKTFTRKPPTPVASPAQPIPEVPKILNPQPPPPVIGPAGTK
jgi:hypothetical protein